MRISKSLFFSASFVLAFLMACSNPGTAQQPKTAEQLEGYSRAYFASGCFWCVEAIFQSVKGVEEAISGYSGGLIKDPSYRLVSSGQTRHAEAVEVYYDPKVVSYETLVKVFFGSHDPTTLNRQGPDRVPQYRSVIYYLNADEKAIAEKAIADLTASKVWPDPIVTEVVPFEIFYKAEDYHQEYEALHPDQPYVRSVSIPRLNRFKAKFPELLKDEAH